MRDDNTPYHFLPSPVESGLGGHMHETYNYKETGCFNQRLGEIGGREHQFPKEEIHGE